ncbi:uncharacterized protein [Lolium perenne]|uniref:uncharacterized protein n=1 Tax=Lolium perenne TaxID=4522 RepID=UPI003A995F33
MSKDEAPGSSQLSLSGFSSLFSISSTNHAPRPPPHPHHHLDLPSLSLSIGTDGEEGQVVSSSDHDATARVWMMNNRESALRSRARKKAYVQELEKEVRRLVDDNLKLKRQCKQSKLLLVGCAKRSRWE